MRRVLVALTTRRHTSPASGLGRALSSLIQDPVCEFARQLTAPMQPFPVVGLFVAARVHSAVHGLIGTTLTAFAGDPFTIFELTARYTKILRFLSGIL